MANDEERITSSMTTIDLTIHKDRRARAISAQKNATSSSPPTPK
jgi:hypothetical protein